MIMVTETWASVQCSPRRWFTSPDARARADRSPCSRLGLARGDPVLDLLVQGHPMPNERWHDAARSTSSAPARSIHTFVPAPSVDGGRRRRSLHATTHVHRSRRTRRAHSCARVRRDACPAPRDRSPSLDDHVPDPPERSVAADPPWRRDHSPRHTDPARASAPALGYAGDGAVLTGAAALRVHGVSRTGRGDQLIVLVPHGSQRSSHGFVTVRRTRRCRHLLSYDGLPRHRSPERSSTNVASEARSTVFASSSPP